MRSIQKNTGSTAAESRSANRGFTIIEVMIVLVIAAVIILIVFLAVPALQRNSRNNQRKNDASRIVTGVQEYYANNPTAAWTNDESVLLDVTGDLSFYEQSDIVLANSETAPNNTVSGVLAFVEAFTGSTVIVYGKGACDGDTLSPGSKVVALYYVETGNGKEAACLEA